MWKEAKESSWGNSSPGLYLDAEWSKSKSAHQEITMQK